jgi:hypothetical protein
VTTVAHGARMVVVAGTAAMACLAREAPAHAQLRASVDRLADAWRAVGASVVIDKPRFLDDDSDDRRPIVVVLPEVPDGACTTVALLGARGLGFHVRLDESSSEDADAKRLPSVAGAVVIERCGEPLPRRFVVASDSGRGAFETVVARSSKALPALRLVLPERSGGLQLTTSEPGPLPVLPAPERRAEVAEARYRRDGGAVSPRESWTSGADGSGAGQGTLEPGCHALQLFAFDPRTAHVGRRGKLDLDAEMRDGTSDRLLARDRTDAPDATLATCVGEPTRVSVLFGGAPGGSAVLVSHAAWPLPRHLPALWGSETQGRMAHVLLTRHVVSLPEDAVQLGQGGYGVTPVPLAIVPGACYVAVVSLIKESARSLGLRVRVGTTEAADDRGIDDDGAVVAFCAGARTHALAEVEARGAPLLGWGLALYRLETGVWEAPR